MVLFVAKFCFLVGKIRKVQQMHFWCLERSGNPLFLSHKIKNYNAKCEDVIPKIVKEEASKTDNLAIVLDPPRKGCDIKVISAIKESNVNKIVYVSCMPSTLARDVGLLAGTLEVKDGQIVKAENPKIQYEIEFIKPFDMFPETKHVETLVSLKRV